MKFFMTTNASRLNKNKTATSALTAAIIALLELNSGCSFLTPATAETRHYLLTAADHVTASTNASESATTSCVVRLRPVEIANYLKNGDIAVRTGTNEVKFDDFQRWAEPLDAGIRRVMAEDLSSTPEIRTVLTDQPAPAAARVYDISIHVLACEGTTIANHQGSIAFKAVWQIAQSGKNAAVLAGGTYQAPPTDWRPGDFGQLASQLSDALNDFSVTLADAISRQTGSHAARQ